MIGPRKNCLDPGMHAVPKRKALEPSGLAMTELRYGAGGAY
ncbi:MAG: hypothetical protein N2050_11065 [Flavobacteriales bacterium]|nr:hypothetical protein [Flavobacteriales bacterium]MCX7651073.1 hypothetical protein [Flavobacteriales bacterium]MDW8431361.1 hypothetical protein [Flavobacteriales bacterium]